MDSNNSIRLIERRNPVPGAARLRKVKRKPAQRAQT
jgi:hypothetical protein